MIAGNIATIRRDGISTITRLVMFCRVCGFRVRVWKSYRSSGYGYGNLTELPKVPGRYTNVVPVPRGLWHGRRELARTHRSFGYGYEWMSHRTHIISGYGWLWKSYRTHRSSGQVHECCTRTPGIVARAYRTYLQKFRVRVCTEFAEVLGTVNTRLRIHLKGRKINKLTLKRIHIYLHFVHCNWFTASYNKLVLKYNLRLPSDDVQHELQEWSLMRIPKEGKALKLLPGASYYFSDDVSYMFHSDMIRILRYCCAIVSSPVPQWSILLIIFWTNK